MSSWKSTCAFPSCVTPMKKRSGPIVRGWGEAGGLEMREKRPNKKQGTINIMVTKRDEQSAGLADPSQNGPINGPKSIATHAFR